ncbi:arylamine N-acetyltransferase family protein [Knoellia subterranea]|uniref:Arylamine N-acetyltransferase n=1 Tax=Knoellia subterranea KCTC 19937 TaxID=1385521 RepID=A0A0A0JR62_9MICO|nr:arylamine N-acetyltransferase [Knoellia subterranea]KGN38051.1 arylamine N-acetyltransferase [Knoellia subterranea KCTC 19937]
MTDPWTVDRLDLEAYLARTGGAVEEPGLAALERLQTAHAETFPFDNLDVLLGTHPGVALETVQEKFVGRGRGGYCFEHATLFGAVLERLGYAVTRHLARVGEVATTPRTHFVLVVDLDGGQFMVDPGIGRPPLGPIPLVDGGEAVHSGWRHRVRRVSEGRSWALDRLVHGEWEYMHTMDDLPVQPVDVEMGHHWTSTHPRTHFRSTLMCTRFGRDADGASKVTTLSLDGVSVRRPDRPTEHRDYSRDELPDVLTELGAHLTADETMRLADIVDTLRAARAT